MAATRFGRLNRSLAGALLLVLAVLMSATVLGNKEQEEDVSNKTCNASSTQGISVSVDTETQKVSFVCGEDRSQVQPQKQDKTVTSCYTNKELEDKTTLEELFGKGSQATVTNPSQAGKKSSDVTVSLQKLPEKTMTIYFGCTAESGATKPGSSAVGGEAVGGLLPAHEAAPSPLPNALRSQDTSSVGSSSESTVDLAAGARRLMVVANAHYEALKRYALAEDIEAQEDPTKTRCVVSVQVPANPAASTCTVAKQNMELEITSESKSVSFQCDTNIDNLTPESPSALILDESCQEQLKLSEKLPSASLTNTNSGYTFSVEELPETAATFCYKCSAAAADRKEVPEEGSNACNVKIKVSAANLDSAASSVATTRSVPLLTSGLAISFLFFPIVL
uniref:SRS domain-containing protein n=1 Tax=Neospora caninum (strain Liverpool) TaxID=572307 RepID=F0JB50_NEOCL|nr:SRS domain-containing protein [Neospora caninum Liverpool]CEL71317.1 TPA: SRS domain-containing protein [Neospora caninum Liverpool]